MHHNFIVCFATIKITSTHRMRCICSKEKTPQETNKRLEWRLSTKQHCAALFFDWFHMCVNHALKEAGNLSLKTMLDVERTIELSTHRLRGTASMLRSLIMMLTDLKCSFKWNGSFVIGFFVRVRSTIRRWIKFNAFSNLNPNKLLEKGSQFIVWNIDKIREQTVWTVRGKRQKDYCYWIRYVCLKIALEFSLE